MTYDNRFNYLYPRKNYPHLIFPYPIQIPDISSFYAVLGEEKTKKIHLELYALHKLPNIKKILEREVFFAPDEWLKKISFAKYYIILKHVGAIPTPPKSIKKRKRFSPEEWTQLGWYRGFDLVNKRDGGKLLDTIIWHNGVKMSMEKQAKILEAMARKIKVWCNPIPTTTFNIATDWSGTGNYQISTIKGRLGNYTTLTKEDFIPMWLANQLGFRYGETIIPGLLERS